MSHDVTVTSTELYTHLHMLRRRSVLESPAVNLPQRDKDRLLVMKIGGNDLFGPNACKMEEWKRDSAIESAMLIATAVHKQSKAQKSSSSSSSRPAKSLAHQSPLDALPDPRGLGIRIADPLGHLAIGTCPKPLALSTRINRPQTRTVLLLPRKVISGQESAQALRSLNRIFDPE